METRFDVVIIGSGIGGLICGNLLAREGLRVCVLEKNKQIGGALQTFSRDKVLFDSGVHYIGGRTLYQVFQYLGIVGALGLLPMDGEAFDKILIEGEDKAFALAPGYERFEAQLCADFPGEEGAIQKYIAAIREVCERFPLYHLRREATGATGERRESDGERRESDGERHGSDADPAHWSADAFIRSLTDNPTLQAVLAGNNILYAGQGDKTPFYVHALILNSYIEKSWKCPDGGSKISGALAKNIRALGGQVRTSAPVRRIVEENGQITHVELEDGSTVGGTHFVSNMHPVTTLGMTDSPLIKKAYRNRMESLENSVSAFCVNVVLKPGSFPYENHNYYYHRKGSLWRMTDYQPEEWPLGYALFMAPSPDEAPPHPGPFAQSLTLMTFMKYEDVLPWKDTFNTVSAKASRGADYEAFKKEKATRLLALAAEKFPHLPDAIQAWYAATPLSYRDYLGTADGAIYGIVKDYTDPLKTTIAPRTKIPNLYLTGQNLHLHGILGSAISALVTGVAILGKDDLIEKIHHA